MTKAEAIYTFFILVTVVPRCFLALFANHVLNALVVAAAFVYLTVDVADASLVAVVGVSACVMDIMAASCSTFIPEGACVVELLKTHGTDDSIYTLTLRATE